MSLLKRLFGSDLDVMAFRAHLPTAGSCEVANLMRMSLVWPWEVVADPAPLVDAYDRELGTTPALELAAPRSDNDAALLVWTSPGLISTAPSLPADWVSSVVRMYQGPLQEHAGVNLGGRTGHLARINHGGEVHWRIAVPLRLEVVQIEVAAPRRHAQAYWLQVETMLATWVWLA